MRYVLISSSYILVLSFVIRFQGMNGARKPWQIARRAFTGMFDECIRITSKERKKKQETKNEKTTTTTNRRAAA